MQLGDLNLFLRVSQTRSMSEAARQLGRTPSWASVRLKKMERELGVRLVDRTTRALRLTPRGEQFLQTCEIITATWARDRGRLHRDADASKPKQGDLV